MTRHSVTTRLGVIIAVAMVAAGCDGLSDASRDAAVVSELAVVAEPAPPLPAPPVEPLDERPREQTRGLDPVLVDQALERAGTLDRLYSMVVARHGEILVERNYRGRGLDVPANVKSVSKSILSALVGIAIAEGHLAGLDQPIIDFFADELDPQAEPEKAAITIGQLLTMQSGLESTSGQNYGRWVNSSNWVRHALGRPLVAEPGTRRIYSTGNTHLLSAILTRATGQSTWAYAREKLAAPLGINLPQWLRDPQGIYFGGNDMHISPRDLVKIGELYRNGGVHEGRQIVPREWIVESWRAHTRGRNGEGYGLTWFGRETNGYQVRYAWGYGGQFLFVVPALELTVVFTSDPVSPREGPHNRALHQLVDELLVPAAIAGAGLESL